MEDPKAEKPHFFACENRKTEPNIGQIHKTENPMFPSVGEHGRCPSRASLLPLTQTVTAEGKARGCWLEILKRTLSTSSHGLAQFPRSRVSALSFVKYEKPGWPGAGPVTEMVFATGIPGVHISVAVEPPIL